MVEEEGEGQRNVTIGGVRKIRGHGGGAAAEKGHSTRTCKAFDEAAAWLGLPRYGPTP
jgi:hypothetical protein